MKRLILYTSGLVLFLILFVIGYIFFRPGVLINPTNVKLVLEKTHVLKSWSWKDAQMEWGYKKWDNRTFKGHFKDFCFQYQAPTLNVDTCVDEISWDVENFKLKVKTLKPFVVRSQLTKVSLTPAKEKTPASPPEIWKYWRMLWSDLTPDMDLLFKRIIVKTGGKEFELDLKLIKTPKDLKAVTKNIHLWANPDRIEVSAPPKIALPQRIEGMKPLYLEDFKLTALMKESGIPLELKGSLASALIKANAYLALPLKDDLGSIKFRKKFLLTATANVRLPEVRKAYYEHAPKAFREFPAPLNVMDGLINLDVKTQDLLDPKLALIKGVLSVNLKSPHQVLDFAVSSESPFNLESLRPESILLGLEFNQVQLQLPRLSKKSPPPQFIPDARFKNAPFKREATKKSKPIDVSMHLQALNEKAMSFQTNLLDEILKLNFDLKIEKGILREGFVNILPLKTKVFKRPIQLVSCHITFHHPVSPVIAAELKFPLPEYKITLKLEGPVSKPRYTFRSEPPLPQNDIYAVLLFGRPMADLDPGDKTSAQKTNQILSQGILSLSVLYFLAGSPVEYVGYDPGSKNATAQFGLGNKTSLRVGGGQEGINSSAIRRSLGKGWYLDTSVQNSSEASSTNSRNYGVLLERIITY